MFVADEETSFVGISELRKISPKVLEELRKHKKIVLTSRNKPVGTIINYEEYKRNEEILDRLEDLELEKTVLKRLNSKNRKFLSLEEVERRLRIR